MFATRSVKGYGKYDEELSCPNIYGKYCMNSTLYELYKEKRFSEYICE